MITILLTILKVLGILLLILMLTVIVLLLLVLFVPVRYRVSLRRKEEDNVPAVINLKVTWLMHLVNAAFSYPDAAFFRIRIFCFTLFRSDKKKTASDQDEKKSVGKKGKRQTNTEKASGNPASGKLETKETSTENEAITKAKENCIQKDAKVQSEETVRGDGPEKSEAPEPETGAKKNIFARINKFLLRLREFFQKLLSLFQNIQYTITQICDKIKHIVNNIQYYLKILKSDTFKRAWTVCGGEAFSLLRSILPGKFTGSLLIGTGDPAGTGEVLAVYGMLYPLLGNHISITPDFERQIVEGELFIKGKITVFKGLKTAWRIYFNRDLRRLIQQLKREAA